MYSFVEMNELFAALRKGYVDACAGHEIVMQEYLRQSGQKYRILDEEIIDSKLGVAFSKIKTPRRQNSFVRRWRRCLKTERFSVFWKNMGWKTGWQQGGLHHEKIRTV